MINNQPNILIVGAGPVGLLLALSLAKSHVVDFEIIDACPTNSPATKAIAYHPITFPLFKKLGIFEDLEARGAFNDFPCWRSVKTGEVLLQTPKPPGIKGILVLPQSELMQVFEEALQKHGKSVRRGFEVVDIQEAPENERLEVKTQSMTTSTTNNNNDGDQTPATTTITAQHLIGADGAHSFIRKWSQIPLQGDTLPFQCAAVDIKFPFASRFGLSDANFLIDAHDFGFAARVGKEDFWRVSFGVSNEKTREDVVGMIPAKFDRMFAAWSTKEEEEKKKKKNGGGEREVKQEKNRPFLEGEFEIVNVAPYKTQQLCVERMRKGSVLLIGDAAHLSNPYGGMGVINSFFDATSLAECLASIVNRGASGDLLDAWSVARVGVFKTVVDPMTRSNFARVQDGEPETLEKRDKMFMAIKAGKPMPPLQLATDVTRLDGWV